MLTTTPPWAFPVDLHGHSLHLCTVLTSMWTRSQKFHSVSTGSEKSHFFTPCPFLTNGGYSLGSRQGMHQPGKSQAKRSVKGGKIRGIKIAPTQHVLGASVMADTSAVLRSP